MYLKRSSYPEKQPFAVVLQKKATPKNIVRFTGKNLYQGIIFDEVTGWTEFFIKHRRVTATCLKILVHFPYTLKLFLLIALLKRELNYRWLTRSF